MQHAMRLAGALLALHLLLPVVSGERLNVLMIAIDDLRPVGKHLGDPEVIVPTLDKLAQTSAVFHNAYCQAATCGVSRSSLLTGRRPDTTQVLTNEGCPFTTNPAHNVWKSLPQYFREAGYVTAGMGKIFHPNVCEGAAVGEQSAAWDLAYYHAPCISLGSIYNGSCYEGYPGPLPPGKDGKVTSVFANDTARDEDMPDGMIAQHAVEVLRQLRNQTSPFFLAVGFHKPHLPHIAPKRYFDLYPENVSLPSNPFPPEGAPDLAWNQCSEFRSYKDVASECSRDRFNRTTPLDDQTTRRHRRAYYAAASYTDAQMGKVLAELEALGLADNTVVSVWGDHGWHLGENNEWAKHTAMSRAVRTPILFRSPQSPRPMVTDALAELVDVFPTIADLAGLPVPPRCNTSDDSLRAPLCTEGASLRSLIDKGLPHAPGKRAVFGQWPKGGDRMGYSVFTRLQGNHLVRYTEWVGYADHTPQWDQRYGVELYNLTSDPGENVNIAERTELAGVVAALRQALHAGWRDVPPP